MKVIVFGGDGFCGWPTSLYLSNAGYDVVIVDNLSRRNIDIQLGTQSLTPITPMTERLSVWKHLTGRDIRFVNIDIAEQYERLLELIKSECPDTVIHFAEQRAAPYSMKSQDEKRYTVDNNIRATHNICVSIVSSGLDIHLIHLGTMGVYGYTTHGMQIPEGYLPVTIEGYNHQKFTEEILYPPNAGSVYHMTKTLDQLIFAYYNKNDKLRITDLHQGIVWGTQTSETSMDEKLINRFDYDGDYGTVLNRFLMQAALDYPLTVHGTGGQTRGFIHIQNTVHCLRLSVENPPRKGDRVLIRNQITETHRVRDLAALVSELTGCSISYVANPRNEDAENELDVDHRCFLNLGLKPVTLKNGLLQEIYDITKKYRDRCDLNKIPCVSCWDEVRASEVLKEQKKKEFG